VGAAVFYQVCSLTGWVLEEHQAGLFTRNVLISNPNVCSLDPSVRGQGRSRAGQGVAGVQAVQVRGWRWHKPH